MSRFVNIEYVDWGKMKEHLFGNENVGNCALCGEFIALDEHHKVTQSKGGTESDIVNLCRSCHDWVGNHPEEASKKGLYISEYKIKENEV